MSSKIRVAVLRGGPARLNSRSGGPSSEYDVSLQTGGHVLRNLPEKYHGIDILIDQNGLWYMGGVPKSPDTIVNQVDVVFNALHGEWGEDGQVQHILQTHRVPFTGSASYPSSLGMNKILSKELFAKQGLKVASHTVIRREDDVRTKMHEMFKSLLMPIIVKPATGGSSMGVSLVHSLSDFEQAIALAQEYGDQVLVEEYIRGKEASCGVIENFRGEPVYALMPIEIRPKASGFFNYDSKYTEGQTDEICPGNFSTAEKKMIEDYARRAHQALGLRHYSRSDFIVTPKRGVYILETNSQPGLTEQSLMPKALMAGGTSISHFLDHVLTLAMN